MYYVYHKDVFNIQELEPEAKMEQLELFTENTLDNGIGNVAAVSNVLASIGINDEVPNGKDTENLIIDPKVTESILNTVSNLVLSDLKVGNNDAQAQSAAKTGGRYYKLTQFLVD